MHPLAFEFTLPVVGVISVHWYGVLTLAGVLAAIWLARREILRQKLIPANKATDVCAIVAIASFAGGHLLYFLTPGPAGGIRVGSVLFGAILGGGLATACIARYYRLPVLSILDLAAPPGVLPPLFGRIGCFMTGCCFGKPADLPWAVTFQDPTAPAPKGIPLHPTQLYEVAFLFGLFLFLLWRQRKKAFDGELTALYLGLYSTARFVIEFFRGDEVRGFPLSGPLSFSQVIAVPCIVGAVVLYSSARKRSAEKSA